MFARCWLAMFCILLAAAPPARAATQAIEARVAAVDAGSGTIRLDFPAPLGAVTLPVEDPAKAKLAGTGCGCSDGGLHGCGSAATAAGAVGQTWGDAPRTVLAGSRFFVLRGGFRGGGRGEPRSND